jgi:methionyl-tRNA formyltransferase
MRIVFIGSVEFSANALKHLISLGANLVGVCAMKHSTFNADFVDLSLISEKHNIPWIYVSDINSLDSIKFISSLNPDIIFCFGWSYLLREKILNLAPKGVVGYHPSELPANRGRHPIIWALALGLDRTASTFFFMGPNADSGDILSQKRIFISPEDNAGTLYTKIVHVALVQIEEFLPLLTSGTYISRKQNSLDSNTWRKRVKADGQIDWRMSARTIHNLVRALTKPYSGAYFISEGNKIVIWKSEVVIGQKSNNEPGKVLSVENSNILIKCGEDSICLTETEPKFNPRIDSYL